MDIKKINEILSTLEKKGLLFAQYRFCTENEQLKLLGKGGFSYVYEMCDKDNDKKRYAVKVIGFGKHTISCKSFCQTVRIQKSLCSQSENVVRIIDTLKLKVFLYDDGTFKDALVDDDESGDEVYISLKFILMDKEDEIIQKDKYNNTRLAVSQLNNEKEVMEFARQIGKTIKTAHDNNVLHRDIKLENIFWDEKDKIYKLGDFGVAKYVEGGNADTVLYTNGYGAPEIERRLTDYYNATADIYSFGICLYLLMNDLKFPGSGGYYVNAVQYTPDFIFPAPLNASDELTRIIRKMCNYSIEDRYQSMREVLADIDNIRRKDGAYVQPEDIDYYDIETETYRDDKVTVNDDNNNYYRHDRKIVNWQYEKKQRIINFGYFLVMSVLCMFAMGGFETDTASVMDFPFIVLPAALFAEAVLQKIKEFDIITGVAIIAFTVYLMYTSGTVFSGVLLMICVLIGQPIITASAAMGLTLMIILEMSDNSWIVHAVNSHGIVWIMFAALIVIMGKYLIDFEKRD